MPLGKKVSDGFHVLKWPEFMALMDAIEVGYPTDEKADKAFGRLKGVEVSSKMNPEVVSVKMTNADGHVTLALSKAHPYTLHGSDEFKAFCKRAGFNYYSYTTKFVLRVFEGEAPTISQTYIFAEPQEDSDSSEVRDAKSG